MEMDAQKKKPSENCFFCLFFICVLLFYAKLEYTAGTVADISKNAKPANSVYFFSTH